MNFAFCESIVSIHRISLTGTVCYKDKMLVANSVRYRGIPLLLKYIGECINSSLKLMYIHELHQEDIIGVSMGVNIR